jgi:superfamily II helicase
MSNSIFKKINIGVKELGAKQSNKYNASRNVDNLKILTYSGCLSVRDVKKVLEIFHSSDFSLNDEDTQKRLQDLCTNLEVKKECRICGSEKLSLGRKLLPETTFMNYVVCETCGVILGSWFTSSIG